MHRNLRLDWFKHSLRDCWILATIKILVVGVWKNKQYQTEEPSSFFSCLILNEQEYKFWVISNAKKLNENSLARLTYRPKPSNLTSIMYFSFIDIQDLFNFFSCSCDKSINIKIQRTLCKYYTVIPGETNNFSVILKLIVQPYEI